MGLNVEAEPVHFTKTKRRPAPAVAAAMSLGEALLQVARAKRFGLRCRKLRVNLECLSSRRLRRFIKS
jgi:hypothetical protein